ncbi:MAG TPA: hypothetical protein VGJ29_13390 [Vicinamibacterales bacterium]|jgi:hypothetical protein
MTWRNDEPEAMTTLRDGSVVYAGINDRVRALLAAGHAITVIGHDAITIEPAIDEDGTEWLRRQAWMVAAILADAAPYTVH